MSEFAKKLNAEVDEWRLRCAATTAEASSHSTVQSPIAPSAPSDLPNPVAASAQPAPSSPDVADLSVGGAANASAAPSTSN
jgi:hypothetical protein